MAVPAGTKVDGASIPQALWSLIGGPFEGKYRDASVIHDYYCDVRLKSWRTVHRVFYNAMRVSGVSEARAKLMYAAVFFGGPRWSDTAVDNANLPRLDDSTIVFCVKHSEFEERVFEAVEVDGQSATASLRNHNVKSSEGGEARLDVNQMQKLIEDHNPSLSEIDKAIGDAEQLLAFIPGGNEPRRLLVAHS